MERVEALPLLVRDGVIAVAVAAFEVVSLAVAHGQDDAGAAPAVAFVVLALSQLPLVVRRRAPVWCWALVGSGTAVYGMSSWQDPPVFAGALLAVYSVAAYASARAVVATGALTGCAIVVGAVGDPQPHDLNDVLLPLLGFSTAFLAGVVMAAHRRNLVLLAERAARAEGDRATALTRVRTEERLRIARELHDVTAHQVAVIAIHAEAGAAHTPEEATEARRAFATIADASRRALRDLRAAVGVLREESPAGRAPLPGLGDLGDLVDELRAAGVDARLEAPVPLPEVGDHIGLTIYRVVQEAVTNILKHAEAAHAVVRVVASGPAIVVDVVDDGRGLRPAADGDPGGTAKVEGGGHGLVGMRERVERCGGTLCVGSGERGVGVRVHATLWP